MEERLQKILSRAGVASRRAAEQIMAEGRITVNGKTVKEPGTKADLATDDVRVDGVRVKAPADARLPRAEQAQGRRHHAQRSRAAARR